MGKKSDILILLGSDSDFPAFEDALGVLKRFEITFELLIASAHRSPQRVHELSLQAQEKGVKVIIAGAGSAAHLAGVIASQTILPVIGVPMDSSPLNGFDALLSTVQMPAGIPVATMAVGKAGAYNAAVFALEILALQDESIRNKLMDFKKDLAAKVEEKNRRIQNKIT